MSCNAKVVCNADLFTSPFDRIVIFSYQIPYISSLFQPQDWTFATYTDRLYTRILNIDVVLFLMVTMMWNLETARTRDNSWYNVKSRRGLDHEDDVLCELLL